MSDLLFANFDTYTTRLTLYGGKYNDQKFEIFGEFFSLTERRVLLRLSKNDLITLFNSSISNVINFPGTSSYKLPNSSLYFTYEPTCCSYPIILRNLETTDVLDIGFSSWITLFAQKQGIINWLMT